MKNLVVLYAPSASLYMFEKSFNNNSAFDLCFKWASSFTDNVLILHDDSSDFFCKELNNALKSYSGYDLLPLHSNTALDAINAIVDRGGDYDSVIFSYSDAPFINEALTRQMLDSQEEYKSEFIYASGYAYSLTPEIINWESLKFLKTFLLQAPYDKEAHKPLSRTWLFDLLKCDINNYEIETLICEEDFRLFRLNFDASSRINYLSCLNIYRVMDGNTDNALELCSKAITLPSVIKTVPSYYNIQITNEMNSSCLYYPPLDNEENKFMSLEDYSTLMKKINEFSKSAYINLSCLCEPLLHPDIINIIKLSLLNPYITLLIETDGLSVTDELCNTLCQECPASKERLIWIVKLDAVSPETYGEINSHKEYFNQSVASVLKLSQYFSGNVYPQFTRMIQNEKELEAFFRFWSDDNSPSKGKYIIQKFSSFCCSLNNYRVADLSPLLRNPCWHLRRDMTILLDGNVPLCYYRVNKDIKGNAFKEDLKDIFSRFDPELKAHLINQYSPLCRNCDEYYTFNF